jgi:hypothetical protein
VLRILEMCSLIFLSSSICTFSKSTICCACVRHG